MWDLKKTLRHTEGVLRRKRQGKPPLHCTPEERAYLDAPGPREYATWEEYEKAIKPLRDAAYPEGDWPGRNA